MKNKSSGRLLDILVMALAVVIGGFLVLLLPRLAPDVTVAPGKTDSIPEEELCTDVRQGRLPGYETAPVNETEQYFWYLYNSAVSFAEGTAPGNVLLENTVGNVCDMIVSFTLEDGRTVYRSPILQPGEYLEYDRLLEPLSAGTYPVSVAIDVYLRPQELPPEGEGESADASAVPQEPIATYREEAVLTVRK